MTMNRPDKLQCADQGHGGRVARGNGSCGPRRHHPRSGADRRRQGLLCRHGHRELEVLPPGDIRAAQWMRPYDMNRRADYQTRYGYFPAMRKPVICAINGAAAGPGAGVRAISDMRFASDTAAFSTALHGVA
ncbi:hypothetical protein ACTMU2_11805 [Cupriavidus basilensis]